jgi:hypothetical protein
LRSPLPAGFNNSVISQLTKLGFVVEFTRRHFEITMKLITLRNLLAKLDCSKATLAKIIDEEGFPAPKGRLTSARNSPNKWD